MDYRSKANSADVSGKVPRALNPAARGDDFTRESAPVP